MSTTATHIVRPEPVFLGYCYKQCPTRPAWLADPRVVDIASVSVCIAKRPEGWVERWDHNGAGLYNRAEEAAAAVTDADKASGLFHLFAYEFFPLRFDPAGKAALVGIEMVFGGSHGNVPDAMRTGDLEFLGYDPVQRWGELKPGEADQGNFAGGFGCSPLTCNNCSREHPTNTHGLLSEWNDAVHAARAFAKEDGAEPGCYYIFGVYRAMPSR